MEKYDVVIRNALIYDGMGHDPFEGDIALKENRITGIGKVKDFASNKEIEVNGLVVCPGFIDVHTHDDFAAILHPDMSFKLLGGVTTCIVGNCGMGAAPYDTAMKLASAFHPNNQLPNWEGYSGYFELIDKNPPSLNIGVLVGHGTLRGAAMGVENRPPNNSEMDRMKQFLHEGLNAGALGLSTGLIYQPGCYADTDEIIELASLMQQTGGLYTSHIRNEGDELLDSIKEAIHIGEQASVPVQISHHKAAGRNNWGKIVQSIKLIEEAQAKGLNVHADQYPYTAGSTVLSAVAEQRSFSDNPGGLGRLAPSDVVIASTAHHPEWEGKTIENLANEFSLTGEEAAEHILREEPGTTIILHSMNEEDVQTVMKHSSTMIGSDGIPTLEGKPHPRLFGTFARVLGHYSRDLNLFPLKEAIYRMTGFSAKKFGLLDRGQVCENAIADLVVFNPKTIIDIGTFENPNQYPEGIAHVFVNGVHVVQNGKHTGAHPGQALRREII